MGKLKWGLSAAAEEMDDQGFYDGPVPPKGRYICDIKRLRVTETQNGDPRFNGLLVINDPRKGKSQYNGYGFWLGINITTKSVRFVTNFIKQGLGVPFKDLKDLDRLLDVDGKADEYPMNVNAIGRVKFNVDGKAPQIVVNAKRRRQNDDPEGDWELTTDDFAPAFPGIDPKKLAAESDVDEDEDDEDDDADDMFEDDGDDEDADDTEDEEEDDEEEDEDEEPLTREELEDMDLPELRELAAETGVMTKVRAAKAKKTALVDALAPTDEDEDEDEDEQEEEPEPPKKTTRRKAAAPAKSTRRR